MVGNTKPPNAVIGTLQRKSRIPLADMRALERKYSISISTAGDARQPPIAMPPTIGMIVRGRDCSDTRFSTVMTAAIRTVNGHPAAMIRYSDSAIPSQLQRLRPATAERSAIQYHGIHAKLATDGYQVVPHQRFQPLMLAMRATINAIGKEIE